MEIMVMMRRINITISMLCTCLIHIIFLAQRPALFWVVSSADVHA
jgi:hypothetical protein